MEKRNIYFVRHGESEGNVTRSVQSEKERLTKDGRNQASRLTKRFKKTPIDVIITSSHQRTRETAEILVKKLKVPVEYSDLFVELRYPSALFGKGYYTEAVPILKVLYEKFHDPDFRHSDEETFKEFKERGIKAKKFLEEREEENILVVTHGAFIKLFLGLTLFGESMDSYELEKIRMGLGTKNTGITHCEFYPKKSGRNRSGWRVRTFNDHAHLE